MITFPSILLKLKNVSDKSCRENQNTHLMFINFYLNIVPFRDNVEKYSRGREATDDNMALAYFLLGTKQYKHTLLEYVIVIPFLLEQGLHEHLNVM